MSIVRENLMTRKGYTPYCGNVDCRFHMPRTRYIGGQFQCGCGWRSSFDDEFIEAYEAKWADPLPETNLVSAELADASKVNENACGSKGESSATCCPDDPNSDPKNENIRSPQNDADGKP